MRLIDADAFDERVRVAGGMSEEELTEDFKDGIQAVLYMLSKQPTINPEPHWIPVTEATPTEDDDYWCTFDAETGRFVDWCSWYQGRWLVWTDDTVSEVSNVIAWCKPFEPYKGVTDGRD